MRIGELARRANVSRDTIRFYERNDLIRSERSTSRSNSYRDYHAQTLETLEMIAQARAAGFSIADLAILINQLGVLTAHDTLDGESFLQTKIDEITHRITQSRKFLAVLKTTQVALAAAAKS